MTRLNYIAVVAMLEADRPTPKQWQALLSMFRDAGQNEETTDVPVQVTSVPEPKEEPRKSVPELLTRAQAAEYLGTTVGTLSTWACTRAVEVPFVKIGRNVRYRRRDLDAWLESQVVQGS